MPQVVVIVVHTVDRCLVQFSKGYQWVVASNLLSSRGTEVPLLVEDHQVSKLMCFILPVHYVSFG